MAEYCCIFERFFCCCFIHRYMYECTILMTGIAEHQKNLDLSKPLISMFVMLLLFIPNCWHAWHDFMRWICVFTLLSEHHFSTHSMLRMNNYIYFYQFSSSFICLTTNIDPLLTYRGVKDFCVYISIEGNISLDRKIGFFFSFFSFSVSSSSSSYSIFNIVFMFSTRTLKMVPHAHHQQTGSNEMFSISPLAAQHHEYIFLIGADAIYSTFLCIHKRPFAIRSGISLNFWAFCFWTNQPTDRAAK